MGHLETFPRLSELPDHIRNCVSEKKKLYLAYATDLSGLGNRFYILKSGLQPTWTYVCGSDTVKITFNVDKFDPWYMRKLG